MNNYRLITSFFLFIFFVNGFSQDAVLAKKKIYVPQNLFKEIYKTKDSLGFIVHDNDTLIEVLDYKKPNGAPVPYEYKDSTFLDLYKKVAFKIKHKDSADTKPMKYWKNPIKIYFSESVDKSVIKDVMSFTQLIDSKVDSLNISRVKNLNQANYIIYYDDDFQFNPNIENYKKSDYSIYWNGNNQIYRGYIRIVKSKMYSNKLATQKIKSLFFSSLGWFIPQSELACESFFSSCYSSTKQFSAIDEALLKYHYSYGICKGTTRKVFEAQHEDAKQKLKENNHHNTILLFYHE